MTLSLDELSHAVAVHAAIRRVRRLQPVGGPGDKIFPPTYPGENNRPARHVFETRRIDGADVRCVLIDSVQSQANRLEEALLLAQRAKRIVLPMIQVDFTGQKAHEQDLSDIGVITSLEAPHRVFDAILRDSDLEGRRFPQSGEGMRLRKARPGTATALFELSPTALLFGAWNSTGEGGGLGAKFTRCIVSEAVGVNVAEGARTGSRIDPLGVRADVSIYKHVSEGEWTADPNQAEKTNKKPTLFSRKKNDKAGRPSVINHSNVTPSVQDLGVTIDHALHTAVITLAGLRRLGFPVDGKAPDEGRDMAARTVLAALGLLALCEQARAGYALRSRCDLVPEGPAPFEFVRADGSIERFDMNGDAARQLLNGAVEQATQRGLSWRGDPIRLTPQPRLVELVALSRGKALRGEAEPDEAA